LRPFASTSYTSASMPLAASALTYVSAYFGAVTPWAGDTPV
jgi:hypothetical protein